MLQLDIRGHEDRFLEFLRVLADASTFHVLQLDDPGEFVAIDAIGIVDDAIRIRHADRLRAEIKQLLNRVLRNIAAAGDQAELAFERILPALQHFVGEVHAAIAGGLRTNQRTAPVQPLTRENAGEFIPQPLVLAEQKADLASAHADVARRDVGVWSNVPLQFGHEALAEAHDFVVALALGIEIRSALSAAHGQRGERVLEDLFERQEFQNAKIHRWVEAQSALVGADGAVHLDAEAAIDLHFARVIEPGHAEHKDSFGLRNAFQDLGFAILRVAFQHGPQGLEHFEDSLVEFRFGWVFGFDEVENLAGIVRHGIKLGRFHDMTHRLASEFYVMNAYVMNGLSRHRAPQ